MGVWGGATVTQPCPQGTICLPPSPQSIIVTAVTVSHTVTANTGIQSGRWCPFGEGRESSQGFPLGISVGWPSSTLACQPLLPSSHRCTCHSSPSLAASCWPPSPSCPSTCGGLSAPLLPHCASRFRIFSPKRYWGAVQDAPALSGVCGWHLKKVAR